MEVRFRLPAFEPAEDGDDILNGVWTEPRIIHVYSAEHSQSEEQSWFDGR